MKSSQLTFLIGAMALAAIIAAPAMAQAPAGPPVPSFAKQVATLGSVSGDTYFWLSDHRVLFLRPTAKLPAAWEKNAQARNRFEPAEVCVLDTRTSNLSPLAAFDSKWATSIVAEPADAANGYETGFGDEQGDIVESYIIPDSALPAPGSAKPAEPPAPIYPSSAMSLSPDGKRLLWLGVAQERSQWISTRLNGSREAAWSAIRYRGPNSAVWQRDSRHWIELTKSNACTWAIIHDVDDPAATREAPVDIDTAGALALGTAADGRIVLADCDSPWSDGATAIELLDLSGPTPTISKHYIQTNWTFGIASDISLSPAGKRLAWISEEQPIAHLVDTGGARPSNFSRYALCTSNLDGSDVRVVGVMRGEYTGTEATGIGYYYPTAIRWLPDGKHVSFIFRDALYVAPAP